MTQNTSSAVMQQRSEPHDSLDDFPTPPWATRALMELVIGKYRVPPPPKLQHCWEPCANRGYMVLPLQEYFASPVYGTDIHDYGYFSQHDFLMPFQPAHIEHEVDWIITNPPFRLAEQIIKRGRNIARRGVAVLVRTSFLEGVDRYEKLYSVSPPTLVAHFAERVIMHKGVLRDPNKEYLDPKTGLMKRPSTATSYTWLVWMVGVAPMPTMWIPPCRRQLERAGDYPNG